MGLGLCWHFSDSLCLLFCAAGVLCGQGFGWGMVAHDHGEEAALSSSLPV